ncbi:MAG: hypothetical protein U0T73_01725 [Chitinophagales bacterium]
MKKISVSDNHSSLMADFFREEEKKLVQKLNDLREVLAQLTGGSVSGGKRRGRPAKAKAEGAAPKKRGRKPGTKITKPYTGKKRGPKPKNVAGSSAPAPAPESTDNQA